MEDKNILREKWRGALLSVRLAAVSQIFIEYEDIQSVFTAIEHRRTLIIARSEGRPLPAYEAGRSEPQRGEGLLVVAASGTGKTMLAEQIQMRFPNAELSDRTAIGSVYFNTPSGRVAPADMSKALLRAMGHPDLSGKPSDLLLRSMTIGRKCLLPGAVVLIDNYHDIPQRRGARGITDAGDWTRSVIDALPAVVVALGTKDAIPVVQSNEQLLSRMQTRIELQPYLGHIREPDGELTKAAVKEAVEKYRGFLQLLDARLPLAESSDLDARDTARRFYSATHGNNRVTRNFLSLAIACAVKAGRESLCRADLFEGYRMLAGDAANVANPFHDGFDFEPMTLPGRFFHRMRVAK